MARIDINAGKLNKMPYLVEEMQRAVEEHKDTLYGSLQSMLNIRKSVCDYDEEIDQIDQLKQTIKTQSDKIKNLEKTKKAIENLSKILTVFLRPMAIRQMLETLSTRLPKQK